MLADRDAQPDDRTAPVDGAPYQPVGPGQQLGPVAVVLLG